MCINKDMSNSINKEVYISQEQIDILCTKGRLEILDDNDSFNDIILVCERTDEVDLAYKDLTRIMLDDELDEYINKIMY